MDNFRYNLKKYLRKLLQALRVVVIIYTCLIVGLFTTVIWLLLIFGGEFKIQINPAKTPIIKAKI
jgi:hypothetical protein